MQSFLFLASEGGAEITTQVFSVTDVMQNAINSVQGDVLGVLGIAVPAIALVVGAGVAVKFGINWLKKMGHV